jgi:hypothetical protein
MPSWFETSFQERVIPGLERVFGVSVTLTDGTYTTDAFTARRSNKTFETEGNEFVLGVSFVMRDFLLPVASCVLDDAAVTPRTGFRITEGSEVFEIQPPDESTPSVELQTGGFDYLVHTKRVS